MREIQTVGDEDSSTDDIDAGGEEPSTSTYKKSQSVAHATACGHTPDSERNISTASTSSKEFDDACFKTPMLPLKYACFLRITVLQN